MKMQLSMSTSPQVMIIPKDYKAEQFISLVRRVFPAVKPINLDFSNEYQMLSLSPDFRIPVADIDSLPQVKLLSRLL
jgi:hypothetical protein